MSDWPKEWGVKPQRVVRPYWSSPGLILRQAGSLLALGYLTGWRRLPHWLVHYGFKCLPGAAGARGMGCIGFPSHPVWEMTVACNLNCIHCHLAAGSKGEDELSTQEGKSLLDQLAKVREFRMMAFTGGEPLVRNDLFELLAYSQALGFTNTIATNATLIDDATARELRRRGVVIAAVSLDGVDDATHDRVRGLPGAFAKTLRGMRSLRHAGILLHINITAMDYNINQIDRLMALVKELGAGILLMYQLVPVGRGRAISDAALDREANERLIRLMAKVQRTAHAVIEPVAAPQYWSFLLAQAGIKNGSRLRLAGTVFHGCSAGRGFVYIKPNGEIWPCPFIEVSAGNVRETPFSTLWETAPVFQALRERKERLKGRCRNCAYEGVCGGCRGRAWATTGDYLAEDPSCFIEVSGGSR